MKYYSFIIALLLVVSLSACGGANNNNNQSVANEPVGAADAAAEANAKPSNETQNEQSVDEYTDDDTNSMSLSGNCDNEYYPVKTGASWNYTMESSLTGTDSFTRSIVDTSDNGFTDQDAWAIGTTRTGTWSCNNGSLSALSMGGLATVSTAEQNFVATSQESSGVTYPSPLESGTNWSQSLTISGDMTVAEGMSGVATVNATQNCTAVGEESVTLTAGTFDTMKLNCSTSITVTVDLDGVTMDPMTIDSTSEVWLARGVGMVKTSDTNEITKSTIELTAYAIP
jgi:hypothetical protein